MTRCADVSLIVDVRASDPAWERQLPELEGFATRVLTAAARRMERQGEVAVLLTDDAEMHRLNQRWRAVDKPTDVLSFPADEDAPPGAPVFLGDIALGYGVVAGDAALLGCPFDAHVGHLLIHGFLHLLGYDHIESEDADVMEPLEVEILAGLGWPDPYQTRVAPDGDPR